jgi:hypothetical protein
MADDFSLQLGYDALGFRFQKSSRHATLSLLPSPLLASYISNRYNNLPDGTPNLSTSRNVFG